MFYLLVPHSLVRGLCLLLERSIRAFPVKKNEYKTRECPISPQGHPSLELSTVKVKLERTSENSMGVGSEQL